MKQVVERIKPKDLVALKDCHCGYFYGIRCNDEVRFVVSAQHCFPEPVNSWFAIDPTDMKSYEQRKSLESLLGTYVRMGAEVYQFETYAQLQSWIAKELT